MSSIQISKANTIETLVHSNIDDFYGPYISEEEAKEYIPSDYRAVGLTVGIYTDDTKSKIKEKWFLKEYIEEGDLEDNQGRFKWILVDKIEEYELILDKFEAVANESKHRIEITYLISGKGLLPKVSISGANISSKAISLGTEETIYVLADHPKNFVFIISATDALGTKFNSNGKNTILEISYGDILVDLFDVSEFENLLPILSDYEGKRLGIQIQYVSKIKNIRVTLNNLYNFPLYSSKTEGNISLYIILPYESDLLNKLYENDNSINVVYDLYDEDGDTVIESDKTILVYTFNILKAGEFKLEFPSGIPNIGYRGSSLIIPTNVKYGGNTDPENIITDIPVEIILKNQNGTQILSGSNNVPVNTTRNLQLKLDDTIITEITSSDPIDTENKNYRDLVLTIRIRVKKLDGTFTFIQESKLLKVYEITSPTIPYGDYYFNSTYKCVSENIKSPNPLITGDDFTSIFPENIQNGDILLWNSDSEVEITKFSNFTFNVDFCIKTSLNGENTPLISIKCGNSSLLTIGKLYITSEVLFREYLANNLALPQNNEYVHIGFGFQRKCFINNRIKYYSCVFINGEIAFSNKSYYIDDPSSNIITNGDYPTLYFNDSFNLSEFSYSNTATPGNSPLVSCVDNNGMLLGDGKSYTLNVGGPYDVFYYNWLTTLHPDELPDNTLKLIEFLLIPFRNSKSNNTKAFWEALFNKKSGIPSLGSPIKKIKEFVKFGNINYDAKPGINRVIANPDNICLFDFNTEDKETYKHDKSYAIICKYLFKYSNLNDPISGLGFDDNKFCIVLVLGTSTLAYPVPNFLFTFIKYNSTTNKFELDSEIEFYYRSPIFNIEKDQNGNVSNSSMTFANLDDNTNSLFKISGETNLVAKADSMDSSHLNNTPTCVYLNSLITSLASNRDISTKFNPDDTSKLDAIVGFPILLKVDSRDTIGQNEIIDYNVSTSDLISYNSYGTFMLNTGKSANNMSLNDETKKVISLEGQSNLQDSNTPSPGIFILPKNGEITSLLSGDNKKVTLSFDDNRVSLIVDNSLNNWEKYKIASYLVNSASFESRSNTVEDDDILEVAHFTLQEAELLGITNILDYEIDDDGKFIIKGYLSDEAWNNYVLHILRMWLFVNQSTQLEFNNYFEEVFNLDYATLYYIHLYLFGQADNLGKNMMIDCIWDEDYTKEIWFIREYDLDSENGLNNNGYDIFPVYGCISDVHFRNRFITIDLQGGAPTDIANDTYNVYNSSKSYLWEKFWKYAEDYIKTKYRILRENYISSEKMIEISKKLVNDLISKEQYNIDFSLKHLGTNNSYLNKGGRFLNYLDWITKRFMYVDSYFSYFTFELLADVPNSYSGWEFTVAPTLIPTFYEAAYLQGITRYGDRQYSENLTVNTKYVFKVVPEALIEFSPIFAEGLSSGVLNGIFKNLRKYIGNYYPEVFNIPKLLEINITNDATTEVRNTTLTILKQVRKLTLNNLNFILSELLFSQNSGIEEIEINNCIINDFNLSELSSLKELYIKNSTINTLNLQNLKLNILKIDSSNLINKLDIKEQVTNNNIIDLSGILCPSINFSLNPTVKKLYLDNLYKLNKVIYSRHDFGTSGDDKKIIVGAEYYNDLNILATNIYLKEDNSPLFLDNNHVEKILPTVETLDLRNCTNLETFSCIGSNIVTLMLPTSVKTLNLLFCKKLKYLSTNEIVINNNTETEINNSTGLTIGTDTGLNFEGFKGVNGKTNLKCEPYWIVYRYHRGEDISNGRPLSYAFYLARYITNESFNLMGCESIYKISNLNLDCNYSNFTGTSFVCGCINLRNFSNTTITVSSLLDSFKFTRMLEDLPTISITNTTTNLSAAFACCGIDNENGIKLNALLNIPGLTTLGENNRVSAGGIFSGIPITESIGSLEAPKVIYWENISQAFGYPAWRYGRGFIDLYYDRIQNGERVSIKTNPDFEAFCIVGGMVFLELSDNELLQRKESNAVPIYILFPKVINANYCFLDTNVDIQNTESIFNYNNHPLYNARSFLAGTKQSKIINLTHCTGNSSALLLAFFYNESNITKDSFTNSNNPCLLPKNTTKRIEVLSMFRDTDLTEFDVNGIFNGVHIERANACFGNTNCSCSGNPFYTGNGNWDDNIDISALFGITSTSKFRNHIFSDTTIENIDGIATITDISWITPHMITSNRSFSNKKNNGLYADMYGVFLGRPIKEFEFIQEYNVDDIINPLPLPSRLSGFTENTTSLNSMFKNCTIVNWKDQEKSFTITGLDSSSIFENTNFNLTNENPATFILGKKVINLKNSFRNTQNCVGNIEIEDRNSILDIDNCFYLCKGNLIFNKKDNINNEEPTYLGNLKTAIRAFSDSSAIASSSFVDNGETFNIFKGCNNLLYIDKIFLNNLNISNITFNFLSCPNIESMNYAFYNSSIKRLPLFSDSMNRLVSAKGTFRKIILSVDMDNFSLNGNNIKTVAELFAESTNTSTRTCTINITSNNLESVDAASTSDKFNITVVSNSRSISACLPSVLGSNSSFVAGILKTTGGNNSLLLVRVKDDPKWSSINSDRSLVDGGSYNLTNLVNVGSGGDTNDVPNNKV